MTPPLRAGLAPLSINSHLRVFDAIPSIQPSWLPGMSEFPSFLPSICEYARDIVVRWSCSNSFGRLEISNDLMIIASTTEPDSPANGTIDTSTCVQTNMLLLLASHDCKVHPLGRRIKQHLWQLDRQLSDEDVTTCMSHDRSVTLASPTQLGGQGQLPLLRAGGS